MSLANIFSPKFFIGTVVQIEPMIKVDVKFAEHKIDLITQEKYIVVSNDGTVWHRIDQYSKVIG